MRARDIGTAIDVEIKTEPPSSSPCEDAKQSKPVDEEVIDQVLDQNVLNGTKLSSAEARIHDLEALVQTAEAEAAYFSSECAESKQSLTIAGSHIKALEKRVHNLLEERSPKRPRTDDGAGPSGVA